MKKFNVVIVLVFALALNACSAKLSTLTPDPTSTYTFDQPGTGNPAPIAQAPVPTPSDCINLSGKYNMNTEIFTLTQVGCTQLTWVIEGQPYLGTSDVTTVYNANDVETPIAVDTSSDPTLTAFMKSHFEESQFVMEERLQDSSGTEAKKIVYSFTTTPCNLFNPDGETYLMAQSYTNGGVTSSGCQFWAKH